MDTQTFLICFFLKENSNCPKETIEVLEGGCLGRGWFAFTLETTRTTETPRTAR